MSALTQALGIHIWGFTLVGQTPNPLHRLIPSCRLDQPLVDLPRADTVECLFLTLGRGRKKTLH